MNKPLDELWLGHPIIALPVCIVTVGAFCLGFSDPAYFGVGLLLLWPFSVVGRANKKRDDYRRWKRAWDGMAQPAGRNTPAASAPQPRRPSQWRPWLGGILLAAVGLFCFANADDPLDRLALAWLVVAVAIAGLGSLIWRIIRPAIGPRNRDTVRVCVTGPLLPVPSLKHAYLALPDHAKQVLGLPVRRWG